MGILKAEASLLQSTEHGCASNMMQCKRTATAYLATAFNQRVEISCVCLNVATRSLEAKIRESPYLIKKSRADVGKEQ